MSRRLLTEWDVAKIVLAIMSTVAAVVSAACEFIK
jgi:hypothetical protein